MHPTQTKEEWKSNLAPSCDCYMHYPLECPFIKNSYSLLNKVRRDMYGGCSAWPEANNKWIQKWSFRLGDASGHAVIGKWSTSGWFMSGSTHHCITFTSLHRAVPMFLIFSYLCRKKGICEYLRAYILRLAYFESTPIPKHLNTG